MAKVKSREEKLYSFGAWKNYIDNVNIEKNLDYVLKEYEQEVVKPKITNINENLKTLSENEISAIIEKWRKDCEEKNEYFSLIDRRYNKSYSFFEDEEEKIKIIEKNYKKHFRKKNEYHSKNEKFKQQLSNTKYFSSLCLKNFKGFSDSNDDKCNSIDIKPITLIYGPNSYGKSSILQSLLLFNQTLKEGEDYRYSCLIPVGNNINLGLFEDFLNKNAKKQEISIKLTLPYNCYDIKDTKIAQLSFCYNFKQDNSDNTTLSKVSIYEKTIDVTDTNKNENEEQLIYEFEINNDGQYLSNKQHLDKYNLFGKKKIKGDFLLKTSFFKIGKDNQKNIFDRIEDILKSIVYVSSYRIPPKRFDDPKKNARKNVGKNGEYTAEILGFDADVRVYVNKWLDKILGYKLTTKKSHTYGSSINLDDNTTEIKNLNVIDLGSGVAQVLPVITQAFKSRGDMILIEEPETHLHPKAQAELGEMFADAVQKTHNTFIIETHSENLLLRLERLIRNGKLSKDDVSIIYVDKNKRGSCCIPLILDDEGNIENITDIPDGFFEEGFNELFDIKGKV